MPDIHDFLAPSGAQVVTLSVRLSVCLAQSSIKISQSFNLSLSGLCQVSLGSLSLSAILAYFIGQMEPKILRLVLFTCHREYFEVPHAADVLEAKVTDLRTPAQEEGVQRQHGGDVADTDVTDVDTPEDGIGH